MKNVTKTLIFALVATICITFGVGISFAKEILIGCTYPLTGHLAPTGLDCKEGVELGVYIINNGCDIEGLPLAKTTGLPNLGGAKIKVVYADNRGDPKIGMGDVERLAQQGVVGFVGAYQSSVTKTSSQAAERLGLPYVCGDACSDTLTARGLKWFFRAEPTVSDYVENEFKMIKYLNETKGAKIKKIAIVNENTEWGASAAKKQHELAAKYGYEVVCHVPYSATTTDVTSEVAIIRKADPDVMLFSPYVSDAILFSKTFKKLNYTPKAIMGMAGLREPGLTKELGRDANYIMAHTCVMLDQAPKKPMIKKVNDLSKKLYGHDLSTNAARSFVAIFVLADAINRAGKTDPEAIRQALLATDWPASAVIAMWDGVKFDPQTHQNMRAQFVMTQIVDGEHHTVFPAELAVQEIVYPIPNWDKR